MDGFQARSRLIGTELWPLFCDTTRFVKRSHRAPIQIALRIKTPVRANKNHRPERHQIRMYVGIGSGCDFECLVASGLMGIQVNRRGWKFS